MRLTKKQQEIINRFIDGDMDTEDSITKALIEVREEAIEECLNALPKITEIEDPLWGDHAKGVLIGKEVYQDKVQQTLISLKQLKE